MQQIEFVLGLTEHRKLGFLLVPYIIDTGSNPHVYPIVSRVNKAEFPEMELSPFQKKILSLSQEYSDKNIAKIFSKKGKDTKTFIDQLNENYFRDRIRPFIERRMFSIIKLLTQARKKIRVFLKTSVVSIHSRDELFIEPQRVEVLFNFIRENQNTSYYLTLWCKNKVIALTNSGGHVLTNLPCIILLKNVIYLFNESESNIDGKKLQPFFQKPDIQIPAAAQQKYFETFILNAIKYYRVNAVGFNIQECLPEIKPVLSLEFDLNMNPVLILSFNYNDTSVFFHKDTEPAHVQLLHEDNDYCYMKINRNTCSEAELIKQLHNRGLASDDEINFKLPVGSTDSSMPIYEYVKWLSDNRSELVQNGFVVKKHLQLNYYLGEINLVTSVDEKADWFDIRALVVIGDFKIPFVKFKKNILEHIREFILPNGEIAVLPAEWFSDYRDIFLLATENKDSLQLKRQHATLINAGVISTDNTEPVSKQILKDYKNQVDLPAGINATLRPYQYTGYVWMWNFLTNKLGVCLADDMGLGKTVQTIALIAKILEDNPKFYEVKTSFAPLQLSLFGASGNEQKTTGQTCRLPVLIVVPTSLVYNWKNEFARFAPEIFVQTYSGANRDLGVFKTSQVVITSYGVLRSDVDVLVNQALYGVICDESQYMKNPESKIYQAVTMLKPEFRLVLTGTPIENSLNDLWAQMNFINPGLLGNFRTFRNEFLIPIQKNGSEEASSRLSKLIEPFIMRRTKDEVASDLPELTEQVVYCEMGEEQREIYEQEKNFIRKTILENIEKSGMEKSKFVLLQGLTRLRLLANHPLLAGINFTGDSGKLTEVIESVLNLCQTGHKVLIFSSFVKHLNLIGTHLGLCNIEYLMLTGNITGENREKIIKEFKSNSKKQVFLISIKAGGVGLNLIEADYVFVLDPWWNPAVENQAVSRVHRIGQQKKVFAYRFITKDTIEEKIQVLQAQKKLLADTFVNANNPLTFLEQGDLMDLIS